MVIVTPTRFEQITIGDVTLTITADPHWRTCIAIDAPEGTRIVRRDPVADVELSLDEPRSLVPVVRDQASLQELKSRFALAR